MLFLDAAYTFGGQRPTFHRARRPDNNELSQLLDTLSRRIVPWRTTTRIDGDKPRPPIESISVPHLT